MTSNAEFCHHEIDQDKWTGISRGSEGHWWDRDKEFKKLLAERWIYPSTSESATAVESVEVRFVRLASEWSGETGHISSASDLINNQNYQEIISLGWDCVPHLLRDLERNKRFWFPALAAITGLRPFDSRDASNYRRMADAWIRWGKRKGLI
jgi:hypothetical protein